MAVSYHVKDISDIIVVVFLLFINLLAFVLYGMVSGRRVGTHVEFQRACCYGWCGLDWVLDPLFLNKKESKS